MIIEALKRASEEQSEDAGGISARLQSMSFERDVLQVRNSKLEAGEKLHNGGDIN